MSIASLNEKIRKALEKHDTLGNTIKPPRSDGGVEEACDDSDQSHNLNKKVGKVIGFGDSFTNLNNLEENEDVYLCIE
jgi:hypothetical protein